MASFFSQAGDGLPLKAIGGCRLGDGFSQPGDIADVINSSLMKGRISKKKKKKSFFFVECIKYLSLTGIFFSMLLKL